jgi:hypothetical protein
MRTPSLRRAALAALLTLGGCSGTHETSAPITVRAEETPREARAPEAPAPATTRTEPAVERTARDETRAPAVVARLEVIRPVDLPTALRARRPTVEIVPQSCGRSSRVVEVTQERVCVQDRASGLSRAMRRFATTDLDAVTAARTGDDVVLSVMPDDSGAVTRHAGRTLRWDLRADQYVALALPVLREYGDAVSVGAADFGVVLAESPGDRHWIFANGTLERVRPFRFPVSGLTIVDGRTYLRQTNASQETLSLVRRDGMRILAERIARYPVATHLPLTLAFPEGRPLVVSAFPHGGSTRVHVVRPPATEVRALDIAVARPRAARMVGEALELRSTDGRFLVDLATGAATPSDAPPPEERSEPRMPRPGSFYALIPSHDGLVAVASGRTFGLDAEGVRPLHLEEEEEDAPARRRSGCRCREDALVCGGAAPIAGACTQVEDLEHLQSLLETETGSYDDHPATSFAPEGRFRLDRLEPDLVRLTRLTDGARLWVRVIDGAVFAQADDGAFWLPDAESLEGFAVRWGRSLLDAPVTGLAPYREAFYRGSLIGDFFTGRPLPTADTTLPTATAP